MTNPAKFPVLFLGILSIVFLGGCAANAKKEETPKVKDPVIQEIKPAPVQTNLIEVKSNDNSLEKKRIEEKINEFNRISKPVPFQVGSYKLLLRSLKHNVNGSSVEKYLDKTLIPELQLLSQILPRERMFIIGGHASQTGDEEAGKGFIGNKALSQKRAEEVLNYIVKKSRLEKSRFSIKAFGSIHPLEGYDPKDEANCRVVISIE